MALKGRIQMKNIHILKHISRLGAMVLTSNRMMDHLVFQALKSDRTVATAQLKVIQCPVNTPFWNFSKHVFGMYCAPGQMTAVLECHNLDWVPSYFHRGICGRNLFDILRPQRWRCTERQNVITAPPHSRRPLDGGQWMTCWHAENSRNALDGARKEVPLWYPNLLPCIWWTHVPLDHGDLSDVKWPKLQSFRGRHATWWYSERTTWGCFGNLHAGSQVIETLGS